MGVKNAMPVDREVLEFYVKTLARWSLELGGHCRTGLEDNVRLDKETLAPSNAALVVQVVRLCQEYGRQPATAAEARRLLGLAAGAA
jgi:3-keto-5-aminohexanoate cleavage enzyme